MKWEGIRALVKIEEGELNLISRSQRDLTSAFPELGDAEGSFRATSAIFDGEIVCLDDDGRPVFQHALSRIQQKSEGAVKRARARHPAVCDLFDCLYLDGRPVVAEPLERRRAWLEDAIRADGPYRMSQALDDGHALFEAAREMGLEGIVDIDQVHQTLYDSPYYVGPDGHVAAKTYNLLSAALERTGKLGVVLRDREDVVLVGPHKDGIILYRIRYPETLRAMNAVPMLEPSETNETELDLAVNLIDSMATSLEDIEMKDRYQDALKELIRAKIDGKEVVAVAEEEPQVIDIMSALKQSIEQSKSDRRPMKGRRNLRRRQKRPRKHARKRPKSPERPIPVGRIRAFYYLQHRYAAP